MGFRPPVRLRTKIAWTFAAPAVALLQRAAPEPGDMRVSVATHLHDFLVLVWTGKDVARARRRVLRQCREVWEEAVTLENQR